MTQHPDPSERIEISLDDLDLASPRPEPEDPAAAPNSVFDWAASTAPTEAEVTEVPDAAAPTTRALPGLPVRSAPVQVSADPPSRPAPTSPAPSPRLMARPADGPSGRQMLSWLLQGLGAICGLGLIVKASIIGYYPDEVPLLVGAGVIGGALWWLGEALDD